jgi:TIR domain
VFTSVIVGIAAAILGAAVSALIAFLLRRRVYRKSRSGRRGVLRAPPSSPPAARRDLSRIFREAEEQVRFFLASDQPTDLPELITRLESQFGVDLSPEERETFRSGLLRMIVVHLSTRDVVYSRSNHERMTSVPDKTRFRALWSRQVRPREWTTLYVYLYAGLQGFLLASRDFARRAPLPAGEYDSRGSEASVARGAAITIIPQVSGAIFNPPRVTVLWVEEAQAVEFRMSVDSEGPVEGHILFFVGPIAVAEIPVTIDVSDARERMDPVEAETGDRTARPYRRIFVSYSHQDTPIVEALERAYTALGDSYLRDVKILRSGEQWNDAILRHIPTADVFQLCWSSAARQSAYVEQEWQCAARLRKPYFIRPVYWENPMPPAPPDLAEIHFTFVPLNRSGDGA